MARTNGIVSHIETLVKIGDQDSLDLAKSLAQSLPEGPEKNEIVAALNLMVAPEKK
jgi:hypothetical protein